MNARTISNAEAFEIFANEDAETLPLRVINEAGRSAVAQFINVAAFDAAGHNLNAWYADADQAANDACPGEMVTIEMRGMYTVSGHPETLRLDDGHFDWIIND